MQILFTRVSLETTSVSLVNVVKCPCARVSSASDKCHNAETNTDINEAWRDTPQVHKGINIVEGEIPAPVGIENVLQG